MPDITAIMQSSNLYVYAMNNPILWSDPSGFNIKVSGSPISDWNVYNSLPNKGSINCYAYAVGWPQNPVTMKNWNSFFPPRGAQPGILAKKNKDYYYSNELVPLMKDDATKVDMIFKDLSKPDAEIPVGTWKIAVTRNSNTGDYHLFRQNSDGSWSHKPGSSDVRNTDNDGNIIYDPRNAKTNWNDFIGFYYVGYAIKEEQG